jgi:hypothetical protein
MTESNSRTFLVLLSSFVAFVFIAQMPSKGVQTASAFKAPMAAAFEPALAKSAGAPVSLPLNKCAVSWTNGGNYILATPAPCGGVAIQAMTIRFADKSCAEAQKADFRTLQNSTYFKGDFGFYLGQGATARCYVVEQLAGRYL